ncbi:MAG: hypothetical protein IJJ26_13380 [Victivallales bacterium]|nr:hypothetical protein [Victivallales bacterium]
MTRKHTSHFSLVELLAVIVIISIILGVTVPAFRNMSTGNSVSAAARMVSSQLMLARAEAISRRCYIAVVMPGAIFSQKSDDTNPYKYQSFRSGIVEPTATANEFTLKEWVPGTSWNFLPTNAVIAMVETSTAAAIEWNDTEKRHLPKDSYSIADGAGIAKVKDGATNKLLDGVTNDAFVRAIIFTPSGKCLLKSAITVMEGVAPNGEIQRENKQNIRVMEIQRYTGQVIYLF